MSKQYYGDVLDDADGKFRIPNLILIDRLAQIR